MPSLHGLLETSAASFPGRPCLDFLGRILTYAEVERLANQAAAGLQRLGIGPNSRVALFLPNCPYFVVAYFAALKAGATVVPCNPTCAPAELAFQLRDSAADALVTLDLRALYAPAAEAMAAAPVRHVVVCRFEEALPSPKALLFRLARRSELADIPRDCRHVPFAALVDNDGRPAPVDSDDVAALQYTGGTTGTPKAAMLSHANLTANAGQVLQCLPKAEEEGGHRVLAILPLSHVFGMTVAMNAALAAGSLVIQVPRFEARGLLRTIARLRPTVLPGVPTLYRALALAPGLARVDMRPLRFCLSGGAPLPAEVQRDFETRSGCTILEGYGLTEASPVVSCAPADSRRPGSVGLPVPGTTVEIRSLQDPRRKAPPGQPGEVCVAGPQVMAGYWNRPEDTARSFVGGLLRTGDVGLVDKDGWLRLVDRLKDVVLCSGYNVYPSRIEEAIYRHPAVAAATVVGVPDDYHGEVPKAFIQLRNGCTLEAGEMLDFLKGHLSRTEMPREVEFRTRLPVTAVGKLSRRELLAEERLRKLHGASP